MIEEAVLQKVLGAALRHGGDFAEVFAEDRRASSAALDDGKVEELSSGRDRGAGIRVSMITGDQPATAAEIARQLGLDRDARGNPLKTVHARELEGLDDEGWARVAAESRDADLRQS